MVGHEPAFATVALPATEYRASTPPSLIASSVSYRCSDELKHVRVDHRGRHIGMPEQVLDVADVIAGPACCKWVC